MATNTQIILVAAFSGLPSVRQLVAIKNAPKTGVNSKLQHAAASGFHKGGQPGMGGGPTGMGGGPTGMAVKSSGFSILVFWILLSLMTFTS